MTLYVWNLRYRHSPNLIYQILGESSDTELLSFLYRVSRHPEFISGSFFFCKQDPETSSG